MTSSDSPMGRRQFLRSLVGPRTAPATERRFVRVHSIDALEAGVLWGAAGHGPDDVLVVGDDGLVLHYDGCDWTRQPNDSELPLHAVACTRPGEAVAVGWLGAISQLEDGRWRLVQGGRIHASGSQTDGERTSHPLFDVWSDGAGDAWAVGDGGRIVHGSGGVWRELESGSRAHLRAIVGLPDGSLLASGADGTLLRGSGNRWEPLDSGCASWLSGLAVLESGDVIAVGGEYTSRGSEFRGRLVHYDGTRCREISTETALPRLRGVTAEVNGFLAVGDAGHALRYDGARLTSCASGTGHDLYGAVSFAGADADASVGQSAWLVGGFGTLLGEETCEDADAASRRSSEGEGMSRGTVGTWERLPQDVSQAALRGVWGDASGEVFAVGDAGTILTFDGVAWRAMATPTDARLLDVWGSGPEDVYAVGESGLVLHFDGSDWKVAYQGGLDLALVAVTGFGRDQVYCVGDGGLVLRYDGFAWERAETGTSVALFDVWGLDADHVLAVGEGGVVLRFNGERWDEFFAGTDSAIYGVWGDALDRIFLSGLGGTLVRFDGQRWIRRPSRERSDLLALAGGAGAPTLAVGSLGTILRHEEGEWLPETAACEESLRAICVMPDGTAVAVGDAGCVLRRKLG